jgi:crossover junction endodeoxyribonuclease RuvC
VPKPKHLVLGIDPGTAILGYGLVAEEDGDFVLVDYGVLTTPASDPAPQRLKCLYEGVTDLVRRHSPTEMAVERLFFRHNVTNAIAVGQARGVTLLAAAEAGLEVAEYTPQQVKQAVAVWGRAPKGQVQETVRMLLRMDAVPRPDDAADALAVAVCHLHFANANRLLALSQGGCG